METSLQKTKLENESLNILSLTDTYRKLRKVNLILRQEVNSVVQKLMKKRFMQSKEEEEMEEVLKVLKDLKEVMRITRSQGLFQTSQEAWCSLP